jgi:hypothetical protein
MTLLNRLCKLAAEQENSWMRRFVICVVRVTLSFEKDCDFLEFYRMVWNISEILVTVDFREVGGIIVT